MTYDDLKRIADDGSITEWNYSNPDITAVYFSWRGVRMSCQYNAETPDDLYGFYIHDYDAFLRLAEDEVEA